MPTTDNIPDFELMFEVEALNPHAMSSRVHIWLIIGTFFEG